MTYAESITAKNETRTIRDLNGQQMLATIEASTTASKAYAVGDYLIANDKIYKVTAAIASGGTITVGTNVAEAKVGTELTELNRQISELETDFDTVKDTLNNKADVIIDSASGSIASFADGTDDMPIKSLAVNIEPSQSGSGDPSPTNVRPISGRTGATIEQRGKNLLNNINPVIINGYLSMRSDGSVGDTVTIRASANDRIVVIPLKNNTYYTLTYIRKGAVTGTTDDWNVSLFYDEPNILSTGISTGINNTSNGIRTIYSGQYNFAAIKIANITKTDFSETVKASQLEIGQTSTTHETYVGSTISVNWETEAGTVYGGTLDVTSGVLTVDRAMVTFNGTEEWKKDSYIYLMGYSGTRTVNGVCSHFPYATANIYQSNGIAISEWAMIVGYAVAQNYTLAEWKAFLSEQAANNTPVTVVYGISTPITYQLAPTEVTTLLGQNNIWTDVGTVDVEYPADTKLYIEQLTKPTEDDMTADHAISSGTFFMIGNSLYLATSQIAAGGTITPGTNATQLSLADALNQLNT